ncbi:MULTISPECIES: hypothetical protein [Rubritalea]|uniref:hypothetical protein n=1 Tax=Rubritalea TaxID=361050 RepID=UPI0011609494|nr:hypothetical protein [Rubritalea squalenifaciens]
MKRLIFSACLAAAGLGMISCEKHDWEDTKKLYQEHGKEEHGDAHGEKKADGHEGHNHGAGDHHEGGH